MIEQLKIRNFGCHKSVQIDFDPKIRDKYMPGSIHHVSYDIELWVDISQEEWKKAKDNRFGE